MKESASPREYGQTEPDSERLGAARPPEIRTP
jgi:hypothetical protein